MPDLVVFERSTLVEEDGYIHSPPSLIVEVLSPEFRPHEREEKLADYACLGVPEFWVITLETRTVEVLYLERDEFRRFALLTEGVLSPKFSAGAQVPVAKIWPD